MEAGRTPAGSTNARFSMAGVPSDRRGSVMKWETPQASDQRFGFEITMYISTR
jgi:coenzyme PQQ precursor peptide PqqA